MKLSYSDFFLVRAAGGKTPEISPHWHPDYTAQLEEDELESGIEPSSRANRDWVKNQCFKAR
jgi:hypothetical protein